MQSFQTRVHTYHRRAVLPAYEALAKTLIFITHDFAPSHSLVLGTRPKLLVRSINQKTNILEDFLH